ncbi:hypothetical protein KM043_004015 [Ampulex compressa]|nr:hypothetical protein KM043_004015 [Ampulex compressa]
MGVSLRIDGGHGSARNASRVNSQPRARRSAARGFFPPGDEFPSWKCGCRAVAPRRESAEEGVAGGEGNECFPLGFTGFCEETGLSLLNVVFPIIKEDTSEIVRSSWHWIERDGPIWMVTKANDTLNR